jgi:hypothetical protein
MSEPYNRIKIYITVDYPNLNDSPLVEKYWGAGPVGAKFLKKAIVEFDINAESHFVTQVKRIEDGDIEWDSTAPKIINANWRADALGGGYIVAFSVGGNGPFLWTARCGSMDLSKKFDQGGSPLDPHSASLQIRLDFRFPDNQFPLPCTFSVTDHDGKSDTTSASVPRMFTGITGLCWARSPWGQRGQGLFKLNCQEPVMEFDTGSGGTAKSTP